jgi:ubiquinone/menaquinone biosynthesis C-methylase UbiE
VDVAPEMLKAARAKGIRGAVFKIADGHALPFEDGRFDVVAAIAALEFVDDAETVVREMVRCARKPGGLLLVGALNAQARLNQRRKARGKPPYDRARLFTARELEQELSKHGDALVRVGAHVPAIRWLAVLGLIVEPLAEALRLAGGAFIVGRVKL